ncbi:MAG: cell division protein ZapA [Oscillospiraceae bacterium]
MNKIKIVLSGKEYTIQTDESVSYVKQLAEELDSKIDQFMKQNGAVSVTSACMLVSLGLMDDCIKASSDKDNLRKQVIDYLEETTRARSQIMELSREIDALKEQNEMMQVKLLAYGDKEKNDEQNHM